MLQNFCASDVIASRVHIDLSLLVCDPTELLFGKASFLEATGMSRSMPALPPASVQAGCCYVVACWMRAVCVWGLHVATEWSVDVFMMFPMKSHVLFALQSINPSFVMPRRPL